MGLFVVPPSLVTILMALDSTVDALQLVSAGHDMALSLFLDGNGPPESHRPRRCPARIVVHDYGRTFYDGGAAIGGPLNGGA
jgi:hypothetical protein